MITAIIQSIIQDGNKIIVNVLFSDRGVIVYEFGMDATPTSITDKIQSDLDSSNGTNYLLTQLQSLVGQNLQTSADILSAYQVDINSNISSAASIAANPIGGINQSVGGT